MKVSDNVARYATHPGSATNANDGLVKEGERVAQLILEQIFTPPVVEVEVRESNGMK
jgi:dUTPase